MSDRAIDVRDLRYSYGQTDAVRGITFDVNPGEIVAFLGPNGAGKTTTVKILTGQLKPKEGLAVVLGIDITKNPEKVQEQIGICFETANLYEKMSGIENLKLFAGLFGIRKFDPVPLLQRVGLEDRGKDRVSSYSKGMKQRLMIARSLVSSPKLLFLDEPTAGLDPSSSQAIRSVILEERDRGAAIFLTTHDMTEADKLSRRVAFMNRGEIVAFDTPHNLKQAYGTRVLRAQVETGNGLQDRELILDKSDTADDVHRLFRNEKVVTLHTQEASLEDIFIRLTGRGLKG